MPNVAIHGTDLYYEDTGGAGEAILFLHGLLWSGRMYAPQIERLSSRFRCVALDFRGQGRSARSETGYDMETLSDDVVALLDTLGIERCHVVGLSMGGFVAMRLAVYHPSRVRSLALLATAADAEPAPSARKYRLMSLAARFVGTGPFRKEVMSIMFGAAFLGDPARARERAALEAELVALDRRGVALATGGVTERRSVVHLLPKIDVPTTVISGADDRAVVPGRSRRAAEAIPGARFVAIPRAGHTATLEEPEAVTAALAVHLARMC